MLKKVYLLLIVTFVVFSVTTFAYASCHEDKTRYPNPLGQVCNIPELINSIAAAAIQIALPLSVIALIFVGLRFITASVSGKPEEVSKARTTLRWILIGTAVVVGSSALAKAVMSFLTSNP